MVDYIADYLQNIRSRRVFPAVSPGYLRNILPMCAPVDGEAWEDIFTDVERCIMPGITHWQSPHMHGYFPALNSPASLLGDMLADAINCLGFTWVSTIIQCIRLWQLVFYTHYQDRLVRSHISACIKFSDRLGTIMS